MSDALEQVVTKAVADKSFRQLLLNDPAKALAGFKVTDEERKMLTELTEETFDAFAGKLGGRDTKGFMPGVG